MAWPENVPNPYDVLDTTIFSLFFFEKVCLGLKEASVGLNMTLELHLRSLWHHLLDMPHALI
jgi:hypothetical protein